MKKKIICLLLAIMVILTMMVSLLGCTVPVVDATYGFYEAMIAMPDGTVVQGKVESCKHYDGSDILQTNHMGVVDNSYSGDNDIWGMPVLAMRDTVIQKNDRICQFRIVKRMDEIQFNEVEHLDGQDRGGFGSTGR